MSIGRSARSTIIDLFTTLILEYLVDGRSIKLQQHSSPKIMFKYLILTSVVIATSLLGATQSMAEITESKNMNTSVTSGADTVDFSNLDRSPEAIEREQKLNDLRNQNALEEQLEWRRKYGDLAPSRQRPSL
jgi:hypothetical protein